MKSNFFFSFALVAAAIAVTVLPDMAFAQGSTQTIFSNGLCNVASTIQSDVGRAIAVLAVLIAGIGAFFGKANWGLVVMIAVGIAAVFGASSLVQIVNSGGTTCPNVN